MAVYAITATNSGGSTSTNLTLAVADGPPDTEQMVLPSTSETLVIQTSNYAPASGEIVTINITVTGASSIALTTSGTGCGALASKTVAGSSLQASGAVASAGQCFLSAAVNVGGTTTTYSSQLTITPTALPAQVGGITFPGGSYFPSGEISTFSQANTLTIQSLTPPHTVVNGGTGSILVTTNNASDVTRAVITIQGIPGYYLVPVTVVGSQVKIDFQLSSNFVTLLQSHAITANPSEVGPVFTVGPRAVAITPVDGYLEAKPGSGLVRTDFAARATQTALGLSVNLQSATDSTVSAPASTSTTVQSVGTGPIQISLTWSAPVDVDLHTLPPSGTDIYYGRRSDGTGGSLDLDSNAGCGIDNIDNENIVWSSSSSPAAGMYTVRVDYWSNCGSSQPIPYSVRVVNCGQVSSFQGTLNSGNADHGGSGSGLTLATFTYQPCAGLSVTGHATYEDISPTSSGLKTTPVLLPIKFSTVEVRRQADDSLLQSGMTDETGQYSLNFSMTTPGSYYVKVISQQVAADGTTVTQKVANNQGTLYSEKSAVINAATTPQATGVDIKATQSDSSAPAFNILRIGKLGFDRSTSLYGVNLPLLNWLWTPSMATCGGGTTFGSCYSSNQVNVNGMADSLHGNDANNNSVLAHEFGHFVNENAVLRTKPAPGGSHGFHLRAAPGLAFSEGLATFWGQSTLGTSVYTQALSGLPFNVDIETPNSFGHTYPVGTADGTLIGNVSEAWVASTLWDLSDGGKDTQTNGTVTYTDTIANSSATFTTLAKLKTTTHNRGGATLTLVDSLDQWLCSSYSKWNTSPASDFYNLVVGVNQFPYAPDAPTATPPITNCK